MVRVCRGQELGTLEGGQAYVDFFQTEMSLVKWGIYTKQVRDFKESIVDVSDMNPCVNVFVMKR